MNEICGAGESSIGDQLRKVRRGGEEERRRRGREGEEQAKMRVSLRGFRALLFDV